MEFISELIRATGFWDLLILWGILLVGPLWTGLSARSDLKSRYFRSTGRWKAVAAVAYVAAAFLFLALFGAELLGATRRAVGPWLTGMLVAALVCAVALPMSVIGHSLRSARDLSSRRELRRGLLGLAVTAIVAVLLYVMASPFHGLGFGVLAAVAVSVGWFRLIIVPDPEG